MAEQSHARGVSIATPESALTRTLQNNAWWMPAALLAVGIAAFILVRQAMSEGLAASLNKDWSRFAEETDYNSANGLLQGEPAALAALATEYREEKMGAWVRLTEVSSRIEQKDFDGAAEALQALREEHPDTLVCAQPLAITESGATRTLTDNLAEYIEAERRWNDAHPEVFGLPDPPDKAPRVRVTTSEGDFVIAMYRDRAPETTKKFVQLVAEGFYDGQAIHGIQTSVRVELGDPHSRTGAPATWGLGGQNVGVPDETNTLKHFKGAVATAPLVNATENSSSRFIVITGDAHQYNGQGTVFGTIVEGMELLEAIDDRATEPGSQRPAERITVEKLVVEAGF